MWRTLTILLMVFLTNVAGAEGYQKEATKLSSASENDKTLYQLQAALAAMSEGLDEAAGELFDEALASIESVFSNEDNAVKARSLWYEEGTKDYKGEPYERAMAFYYRGLLDLKRGDYENARAAFRSGILQDAFAEEMQHRSDFASLMLLEGWTNKLLNENSMAKDAFVEVANLRPGWKMPASDANTLLIVELGGSPRKVGDGIGSYEIVYRPARNNPERSVLVNINGNTFKPPVLEDLLFQASTRGGRAIDRVIQGKVSFQSDSAAIGNLAGVVASEGSVIASATGGGGGQILGGLAAVGAIASLVSVNVKPRADVRYWSNLPSFLLIDAVKLEGDPYDIKVELRDVSGNPISNVKPNVRWWNDDKRNRVIWIRSRI